MYYRGAACASLVYDISNRDSFESIENWYNEIMDDDNHPEVILIGNKCDLLEKRTVEFEEGVKLAENLGIPFFETSAKTSVNITISIETAVYNYLQRYIKENDIKEKLGLKIEDTDDNEVKSCW